MGISLTEPYDERNQYRLTLAINDFTTWQDNLDRLPLIIATNGVDKASNTDLAGLITWFGESQRALGVTLMPAIITPGGPNDPWASHLRQLAYLPGYGMSRHENDLVGWLGRINALYNK